VTGDGRPDPTEGIKLGFDNMKQLTTLNAGSIVLIGTFLTNIFPTKDGSLATGPTIKALIAAAFILFGVLLLLSAYSMFVYTALLEKWIETANPDVRPHRVLFWVSRVAPYNSFVLGLGCFGAAVLMNLYR
jgi:hypothetical protein